MRAAEFLCFVAGIGLSVSDYRRTGKFLLIDKTNERVLFFVNLCNELTHFRFRVAKIFAEHHKISRVFKTDAIDLSGRTFILQLALATSIVAIDQFHNKVLDVSNDRADSRKVRRAQGITLR